MTNEIPSVLACDVGNSAVRFAHVKGEEVTPVQRQSVGGLKDLGAKLSNVWHQMPEARKIAACSVYPAGLKALEAAVEDALGQPVLVVGRDLPLPIETRLPRPQSCGADRLCAASAAFDRLGTACAVADFGTAVTIDCVNEHGVFLGGSILPGLGLAAACLSERTAQLPLVEPREPDGVIGVDTEQAILGGLVHGVRGALRGLVEAYATEMGYWPPIIATGADAALVCQPLLHTGLVQAVVEDLSLRGVAMAYYKALQERM